MLSLARDLGAIQTVQLKPTKEGNDFWVAVNLSTSLFFTASLAWLYSYLWGIIASTLSYWHAGNLITQSTVVAFSLSLCVFPLSIALFALWIERVIRKEPRLARILFGQEVTEVNK